MGAGADQETVAAGASDSPVATFEVLIPVRQFLGGQDSSPGASSRCGTCVSLLGCEAACAPLA